VRNAEYGARSAECGVRSVECQVPTSTASKVFAKGLKFELGPCKFSRIGVNGMNNILRGTNNNNRLSFV
jgi:hypothetical protein